MNRERNIYRQIDSNIDKYLRCSCASGLEWIGTVLKTPVAMVPGMSIGESLNKKDTLVLNIIINIQYFGFGF